MDPGIEDQWLLTLKNVKTKHYVPLDKKNTTKVSIPNLIMNPIKLAMISQKIHKKQNMMNCTVNK